MKTRNGLKLFVCLALFLSTFLCSNVKAQTDDDNFDLNKIVVSGELYLWNRISDVFDILRCGIGFGGDIGVDLRATQYAQLAAMVTNEKAVDFPHFIPPLWLIQYYSKKNIFNFHEGYSATAAFGPWRAEDTDKVEGRASFPRNPWDIELEVAAIGHLYVDVKTIEIADLITGFVGYDIAEDDEKLDNLITRKPVDQFGRGLTNILFGVLEVPINIFRITEDEGDLPGCTKGVGLGVWRFLVREVVGVVELVTFPFGWEPIIEPEYIIQKAQSTEWNVRRPSFHKRF